MSNGFTRDARNDEPRPFPPPNKLQQALCDYDRMEAELALTKDNLESVTALANRAVAEADALRNSLATQQEFFTRQIDLLTTHRDRLAVALRGLMTRFKVIREVFTQAETEALAEGLAINEKHASTDDGATPEQEQALKDLALHDGSRRRPMPPIAFGTHRQE